MTSPAEIARELEHTGYAVLPGRMNDKDLTAKYGERFQAQDMQDVGPLPAGILGPVRILQ